MPAQPRRAQTRHPRSARPARSLTNHALTSPPSTCCPVAGRFQTPSRFPSGTPHTPKVPRTAVDVGWMVGALLRPHCTALRGAAAICTRPRRLPAAGMVLTGECGAD
ncbi:hypothetical protein PMIN01_12976 [Paraphaeosphaeria minitans]|uniref:Uncharacterized protein n=1 Tax=Paraphaeosphaeria minitans TaxID=565426 RepID=A0A9P6G627_9PLEO|nr:hypothetical protein PMIN01_12976 [Paraphaeosphaeria minitans]